MRHAPVVGGSAGRRAVVTRYETEPGFPEIDVDDVFLGNGVSELITMVMQALLDEGDEVLIPSPDYPLWTAMTSLSDGVPVHYRCDESNGWQPDLDHYDVPDSRVVELVALGAVQVSAGELIRRLRASGLRVPARERGTHHHG